MRPERSSRSEVACPRRMPGRTAPGREGVCAMTGGPTRRLATVLLAAALLLASPGGAAAQPPPALVPVFVTLAGAPDLSSLPPGAQARRAEVVRRLQRLAQVSQAGLLARLAKLQGRGQVAGVRPLWLENSVALRASAAAVAELAALPGVRQIRPDAVDVVPAAEPGIAAVGAPALWSAGSEGAG